jgi:hypothetical protein
MGLQSVVKGIEYYIDIPSINASPDNKLDACSYEHLYSFYQEYESPSYHSLVGPTASKREEFYFSLDQSDLILIAVSKCGLDYSLDENILTVQIWLYDNDRQPLVVPYLYDLNNISVLYELEIMLNQDNIEMFFVEFINDVLTVVHNIDIILPEPLKDSIRGGVDAYIEDSIEGRKEDK